MSYPYPDVLSVTVFGALFVLHCLLVGSAVTTGVGRQAPPGPELRMFLSAATGFAAAI
jgi:hypothetical protein